jgi:hypothetical protein
MKASAKSEMRLGYPKKVAGFINKPAGYWEHTFGEMCDQVEEAKAEAVNAAIEDLETAQQMAVYHKHLFAVFKFERLDVESVYQKAREALAVMLPKRTVW